MVLCGMETQRKVDNDNIIAPSWDLLEDYNKSNPLSGKNIY